MKAIHALCRIYVRRNKWNEVMDALVYLYEQYYSSGEIDDAVKHLMATYDHWLDEAIEHLKGLRGKGE